MYYKTCTNMRAEGAYFNVCIYYNILYTKYASTRSLHFKINISSIVDPAHAYERRSDLSARQSLAALNVTIPFTMC